MKKILIALLVIFLILWIPYFVQTYKLQTLTASDLPTEGAWASLEEGNLYFRWHYPDAEVANNEIVVLVHGFSTPHFVWDGMKGFLLDAGYSVLVFDHATALVIGGSITVSIVAVAGIFCLGFT